MVANSWGMLGPSNAVVYPSKAGSVPGVEGFMVEYHFYTDDQQNVRG